MLKDQDVSELIRKYHNKLKGSQSKQLFENFIDDIRYEVIQNNGEIMQSCSRFVFQYKVIVFILQIVFYFCIFSNQNIQSVLIKIALMKHSYSFSIILISQLLKKNLLHNYYIINNL